MAEKLYRCVNPAHGPKEFWTEDKVQTCPHCGLKSDHPRWGGTIAVLTIIHLDPPDEMPGYGKNVAACTMKPRKHNEQMTGVPSVVNCKACRETEAFKKAEADWEEHGGDAARASLQRVAAAGKTFAE